MCGGDGAGPGLVGTVPQPFCLADQSTLTTFHSWLSAFVSVFWTS